MSDHEGCSRCGNDFEPISICSACMVAERDALKAENVTQRDEIGRLHHEIEGWKAGKAYAVDEAVRFFNLLLEDSAERDALKARVAEMDSKLNVLKSAYDSMTTHAGDGWSRATTAESTLAQRDREILALRIELDACLADAMEYRGYADAWEWKYGAAWDEQTERTKAVLESTAQAGAEAERRIRQDEREKAAALTMGWIVTEGFHPLRDNGINEARESLRAALGLKAAILGTESREGR